MSGTTVDYEQARYFDALLTCLDDITAAATMDERERFAYRSVRRVLVRFVQDPTDRPGFAELGVDTPLEDATTQDPARLRAAVIDEERVSTTRSRPGTIDWRPPRARPRSAASRRPRSRRRSRISGTRRPRCVRCT